MISTEKYIQIPYKSTGRDFDGCDCYGLVRLVLKEEFHKELPLLLNEYNNANDTSHIEEVVSKNLPLLSGKQVDVPKEGDVAVFRYKGNTCHIGICVDSQRVLHILNKTHYAVCEKVDSPFLRGRLEGFYEVR